MGWLLKKIKMLPTIDIYAANGTGDNHHNYNNINMMEIMDKLFRENLMDSCWNLMNPQVPEQLPTAVVGDNDDSSNGNAKDK